MADYWMGKEFLPSTHPIKVNTPNTISSKKKKKKLEIKKTNNPIKWGSKQIIFQRETQVGERFQSLYQSKQQI